jgi:hypothetical protein
MALTIYPDDNADSFISLLDATDIITKNSLQAAQWIALDNATKEVYLRIAFTRIMGTISTDPNSDIGFLNKDTYESIESCLPKTNAIMAVHDLVYGLSSEINPNTGLVTKEKVGDIEITYTHGANTSSKQLFSRETNPFPDSLLQCLRRYGSSIAFNGLMQARLVHS